VVGVDMPEVNWIAVIAATVASFVIGGLWYSPLSFAKSWQKEASLTDEQITSANMVETFAGAFFLMLIAAVVFAMFLAIGALLGAFPG
jgi:hypothetical protein